jgi:hypothetical protein
MRLLSFGHANKFDKCQLVRWAITPDAYALFSDVTLETP